MDNQIFCPQCGKPSAPGTKFCASCGAQIPEAPAQAAPQQAANDPYAQAKQTPKAGQQNAAPAQQAAPQQAVIQPQAAPQQQPYAQAVPAAAPAAEAAPKGPSWFSTHKNIVIIAAAVVAVVVIAIILLYNLIFKYTKIDAKDLVKVEFNGIDGQGTVTAELNAYPYYMYLDSDDIKDALGDLDYDYDDEDLDDALDLIGGLSSSSKSDKETVSKYLSLDKKTLKKAYGIDEFSEIKKMRKALLKTDTKGNYKITVKVDKKKGLKNGDKVKCTVKYPESSLKSKNIKLTNTEFEVTVKGLKKGTKIDPFDCVSVSFDGFDGQGSANVTYDTEKYDYQFYFDYSYSYDLSNGDTYPVTCYFYADIQKDGDTAYFKAGDEYYVFDAKDLEDGNKIVKNYTVEGLQGLQEIDPFDGISFEYSGALPFVKASYVNSESVNAAIRDNVYFSVDCPDYLGEDGEFEVTCSGYYGLQESGYALKGADSNGDVKKTFKVSELTDVPSFVTKDTAGDTADFYADLLEEKVAEAKDDMIGSSYSYLTNVDGDVEEADLAYSSTYVAYTKDTEYDYSTVNRIYWLYKATFTTDEGKDGAFYYVFYTTDVKSFPDGTYTNPDDIYISSTTVKNMDAFNETYVDGYEDDFTTEKAS